MKGNVHATAGQLIRKTNSTADVDRAYVKAPEPGTPKPNTTQLKHNIMHATLQYWNLHQNQGIPLTSWPKIQIPFRASCEQSPPFAPSCQRRALSPASRQGLPCKIKATCIKTSNRNNILECGDNSCFDVVSAH
jgi:hypothetical protein